ncbi:MAG TPA: DUF1295 domain-containing protein [Bacteroidales bacterium]|nr:DUF1295 domain-containing protein [Bacteroidales bacterium]
MEKTTFDTLIWLWISVACLIFIVLLFITAPYGRHTTRKWGFSIPNRLGWLLMELPTLLIFLYFIVTGKSEKNVAVWIVAALFSAHYINRSIVFPFRIRTTGKQMPLLIALMAIVFNTVNASFIGYYTGTLQTRYTPDWLTDPRFIIGLLLFITGMIINLSSDEKLIHLRKSRSNGYQIPRGGLFNKISCPNFFGEIIEWLGFAVLCWSLPAFSFFVWTFCNLIPRAFDHHRWYKKTFADYPQERKAVLPYLL